MSPDPGNPTSPGDPSGTIQTLTTYSDSDCLVESSVFNYGDVVYFNCPITASLETVSSPITIKTYLESSDTLIGTILDTTYSFATNTLTSLKTDICADTAPNVTLSASYPGDYYYAVLSISGNDVDDITIRVYFSVVDKPTISAPSISDTTITQDMGVLIQATISSECNKAVVVFLDSSGLPVYAKEMLNTTGTTWACTTDPMKIPVDTYAAGDINIYALNEADAVIDCISGDSDSSLTLTVSTASGLRSGALRWLAETIYIKYHTGTYDSTGMMGHGDWTATSARVIRGTQKVMDTQGEMVVSSAQIWVSGANDVGIEDKIKFANDFSTTAEARIIRVDTVTKLSGAYEYKVIYI